MSCLFSIVEASFAVAISTESRTCAGPGRVTYAETLSSGAECAVDAADSAFAAADDDSVQRTRYSPGNCTLVMAAREYVH